jgi:Ca2+-binding RTX toxin-like protein
VEKVKFTGGSGDDTINTNSGAVTVDGGADNDLWLADYSAATKNITFRLGSTTSLGAVGLDSIQHIERISLATGSGADTIRGGSLSDVINTGAGSDTIDVGMAIGGGDLADGGAGKDTLIFDASAETQAVQLFAGSSPSFSLRSTSGNFFADVYNVEIFDFTGGAGNDNATGGDLNELLAGSAGDDALTGGAGADALTGGTGLDTLNGGDGNDTIDGGKDSDVLRGGVGADALTGGGQADVFDYDAKNESSTSTFDTIGDFQVSLDDINLADLDANSTVGGLQHFTFIGTAGFSSTAGELRAVAGLVEADLNGDGAADFRIVIGNGATLGAGDFILS